MIFKSLIPITVVLGQMGILFYFAWLIGIKAFALFWLYSIVGYIIFTFLFAFRKPAEKIKNWELKYLQKKDKMNYWKLAPILLFIILGLFLVYFENRIIPPAALSSFLLIGYMFKLCPEFLGMFKMMKEITNTMLDAFIMKRFGRWVKKK